MCLSYYFKTLPVANNCEKQCSNIICCVLWFHDVYLHFLCIIEIPNTATPNNKSIAVNVYANLPCSRSRFYTSAYCFGKLNFTQNILFSFACISCTAKCFKMLVQRFQKVFNFYVDFLLFLSDWRLQSYFQGVSYSVLGKDLVDHTCFSSVSIMFECFKWTHMY